MPVTRERFEQGFTYEDYKARMTRNLDRLESNEATVELSREDVAFFAQLPEPLNVLVLAEDWCGDVIANLPVLARLAAESGKLKLRIFPRDEHLDIMDQYLKDGQFRAIPVFVFFDGEFNELGHWIERPAIIAEQMARLRADIFAREPALAGFSPQTSMAELPEEGRMRVAEAFGAFRAKNRAFSDREVVREIRAILEPALQIASSGERSLAVGETPVRLVERRTQKRPVKVRITYCAECGYEPQTLALTSALMREFVNDLASIELIPWHDGAFDVVVEGDLVHSMMRDGGFPEHQTIIRTVRDRIAASSSRQ